MRSPDEVWQADINGQIYETTFGELTAWISDNALMESDKVRRGNLRWLEAGKVPALVPFFNSRADGSPMPAPQVTTTIAEEPPQETFQPATGTADVHGTWSNSSQEEDVYAEAQVLEEAAQLLSPPDVCCIHPEVPSSYMCSACSHPFCRECPEGFGSTVRLCPYCGAMCKEIQEMMDSRAKEDQFRADMSKGFGFDDFGAALSYPFRYKSSLFFGGLLFSIFGIGQSAGGIGSIFLVAAAIICFMMANALTFGVLANTVDNFSQGIIERDFMPSFDDFSLWDDVVHPFFLSIAVYVSSFGLLILIVAVGVWYAWSTFTSAFAQQADPAAAMMVNEEGGEDPKSFEALLERARQQSEDRRRMEAGEDIPYDTSQQGYDEEAEFQQMDEMATEYRKAQLESVVGKTPEAQEAEMQAMLLQFVRVAGAFVVLAGLALLWGIFYFPAACAVAGYTRSFVATINPLVGLDTIRHLGVDYFKILVMTFIISIMSGIIGMALGLIFFPFNLPTFGNLPAKFFAGFATFYFSVVLSVILGYALYKNSEKLRLYRS